ncbi:MAG: Radial spokehead-like protein [Paramarteilia canceri]
MSTKDCSDSLKSYLHYNFDFTSTNPSNQSKFNGKTSIYSQLVKLVHKLLKEKPENPLKDLSKTIDSLFCDESQNLKSSSKLNVLSGYDSKYDQQQINQICKNLYTNVNLFTEDSTNKAENDTNMSGEHLSCNIPDIFEELFYLKRTGVGISEDEVVKIWISMRKIVEKYENKIRKIRFGENCLEL